MVRTCGLWIFFGTLLRLWRIMWLLSDSNSLAAVYVRTDGIGLSQLHLLVGWVGVGALAWITEARMWRGYESTTTRSRIEILDNLWRWKAIYLHAHHFLALPPPCSRSAVLQATPTRILAGDSHTRSCQAGIRRTAREKLELHMSNLADEVQRILVIRLLRCMARHLGSENRGFGIVRFAAIWICLSCEDTARMALSPTSLA